MKTRVPLRLFQYGDFVSHARHGQGFVASVVHGKGATRVIVAFREGLRDIAETELRQAIPFIRTPRKGDTVTHGDHGEGVVARVIKRQRGGARYLQGDERVSVNFRVGRRVCHSSELRRVIGASPTTDPKISRR
jgi:hypothetical protein